VGEHDVVHGGKGIAICASHHGGDEREYRGHHALIGRFKRGTNRLNRDLRDRLEGSRNGVQGAAKHCEEPVTGRQRILINVVAI
jgi:hypothetical protein